MRKLVLFVATTVSALALTQIAFAASTRDYISIVGSSTVYPFATVVAERFGKTSSFKTPKVESTGSGGGIKLFCAGVGVETPDIANSSRRMKETEFETCTSNGVGEIVEVKIGYDGIAIARSKKGDSMDLGLKDIFLALAKEIPDPKNEGKLMPNPHRSWSDVNPALPASKIEVLGPPPTSGTRDAFAELAMEGGCKEFTWIKELKDSNKDEYKRVCHTIREDGHYIEAGENDNLIVQKLEANANALGIFGFSFLDQNTDRVSGFKVNGVAPEFETISSGDYPVSRPLYFYVKKAHIDVIPGIKEYLGEFASDKAWGDEGYLTDKGLIPMPGTERAQVADDVNTLKNLNLSL